MFSTLSQGKQEPKGVPGPSSSTQDPSGSTPGTSVSNQSTSPLPSVNNPKGGGAIKGIDEKLGVNAVTGTASTSIAVPTSTGRSEFGPQLSLDYDSGAGNGTFGFGWHVSLPEIARKTDKGLPQYEDERESDVFVLAGTEDLVPTLEHSGKCQWEQPVSLRKVNGRSFRITRYRPRIEGGFSLIERWTDVLTQESHWRTISGANVTAVFGYDGDSRVYDPRNPVKIFRWLISHTYDDHGNAISFRYKRENADNVPLSDLNETNMDPCARTTQRYPKSIKYGNVGSFLLEPRIESMSWMFEVMFDYGEHDQDNPSCIETKAWDIRPDPFSTRRSGFEIRTYRLCKRILMFHHFPDEPGIGHDCAISSLDVNYHSLPHLDNIPANEPLLLASCVSSFSRRNYLRQNSGYTSSALPPVEFDYTSVNTAHKIHDLDAAVLRHFSGGIDGSQYFFLDLDGEGIPGVLTQQGKSLYYSVNRGGGQFDPPKSLPFEPIPFSGSSATQQWMDFQGDGQVDLLQLQGPMPGFSKRDRKNPFDWSNFQPFHSFPNIDINDPNIRFIDLTGDGRSDILIVNDHLMKWHESWAEEGFGPAKTGYAPVDEESGPRVLFSDGLETIYLADMTGDGLSDIVRIRNGEICYWPNLGRGSFGSKVPMKNAPFFDFSDRFKQERLHIADIDGTGTSDILYAGCEGVKYYLNQSGNAWTSGIAISTFPRIDDNSSVQVVDLLGVGTSCLVWSSALPGHEQRQIRYVDLVGPVKPYLISATRNNFGAESRLHYASSTKFYLQDKQSGHPWATRIPFPVQVVESVESEDRISGNRFCSRYAYHHGHFDGVEREFRGFGRVEQWDTEDLSTLGDPDKPPRGTNYDLISDIPPVLTKTWFHTGAYLEGAELQQRYECEYWSEPASGKRDAWRALGAGDLLPKSVRVRQGGIAHAISSTEAYEASRALKGAVVHSEIYALDGTKEQGRPYKVAHSTYNVELLQPQYRNEHAVFMTHQRETITLDYERKLYNIKGHMRADPRVTHAMTLSTDEFGNVLETASIAYGRRFACADPFLNDDDREKQSHLCITLATSEFTNAVFQEDARRLPLPSHSKQYELHNATPQDGKPRSTSRVLKIQHVREAVAAVASGDRDLPYEDFQGKLATQPGPYRRLLSHSLALYRKDNLEGVLPAGQIDSLAIPDRSFTLAFTENQLRKAFVEPGKLSEDELERVMVHEGGYHYMDRKWWKPSGRTYFSPDSHHSAFEELQYARQHFFIPRRAEDPFGALSFVELDKYDLLVKETRDVYGNRVTVGQRSDPANGVEAESGFDYRVLGPYMVQDANGNRALSSFDILGMVVGSAGMGKPYEKLGDNLNGFVPDLTKKQVQDFFADPKSYTQSLLVGASSRFIYDSFAYYRSRHSDDPQPSVVCSLSRETHVSDSELGQDSRVFLRLAYFDGLSRTIQEKMPAEPGPVTELPDLRRARKRDYCCQYAGDDHSTCYDRWITSGWTSYNNKGMKVRVYEPFFSRTHEYERDNKLGVSPITFYDPLGRAVAALAPDHTWTKSLFEPWRGEVWDKNDTALIENPAEDPDVGDYFKRLSSGDYLPTWYQQHRYRSTCPKQKMAAAKTAAHAHTPSFSFSDSLGRPILTVTHKRQQVSGTDRKSEDEYFFARKVLDIEGKEHNIWDTKNRLVSVMAYGQTGELLYHSNMDSGERWSLPDINGSPMLKWDSREQQSRTTYDRLRRVKSVYLKNGREPEVMIARTIHGESTIAPERRNCRGMVIKVYDQSGLSITEEYDFKGNLITSERQLAKEFRKVVDVSEGIELEPEIYVNHVTYDALNRQTSMTLPNGARTRYVFNVHGEIQQVWSKLDMSADEKVFVKAVEYDAKGKQVRADYGNGSITRAKYDLYTFRLLNTKTTVSRRRASVNGRRDSSPHNVPTKVLLDMSYTYDAMGNLVHCGDKAQDSLHFRGKVVHPDQYFTYDSLYRLVEAQGREHLGQSGGCSSWNANDGSGDTCQARMDHPHNGNAMTRYVERYQYDSAGNIQKMQHESEAWHSWTRRYRYNEQSLVDSHQFNNRLSETQVGSSTVEYCYEGLPGKHGNMTSLPGIPQLSWNFRDQLRSTCRQPGGAEGPAHEITWYVYDDTGKRVRKVLEQPDTKSSSARKIKETRYIGGSYEIFRTYTGGSVSPQTEIETLSVSSGGARIAMIENRLHGGSDSKIPAQLIRFQYSNYQNSVTLEVDDHANVISYEEYTPYGSTSYQAMHTQTEVPKRYRFTGKEKDTETGLYYHGMRYYMAGIARWTSADPKGLVDGLNLYLYARANPVSFVDPSGTETEDPQSPQGDDPQALQEARRQLVSVLSQRPRDWQPKFGFGDPTGYFIKNPQWIKSQFGRDLVVQSHVFPANAWELITKGAYGRSQSAGSPFEYGGKTFNVPGNDLGRELIILNHPEIENKIEKNMSSVMTDLKNSKIDDAKTFFGRTKEAWTQAHADFDEAVKQGDIPAPKRPVAFKEPTFDRVVNSLTERMEKIGAPTTGWAKIAAEKVAAETGTLLSRARTTVGKAYAAAPAVAGKVADGLARNLVPLYGEFVDVARAGGFSVLAAQTVQTASKVAPALAARAAPVLAEAAAAIEAAPAAAFAGIAVTAAAAGVGGYIVGGAVGGAVRQATGSDAAGIGAAALSGAATGAAIGFAVGSLVGVAGPAGLAIGGIVGGIAGALSAW